MSDSLADTIVPKSDQLNADDLLIGPITVTVESVRRGTKEQPVSIGIGGGRQPYKPCKSMRRVLIAAWGDQGSEWVGKRMTLYCDPNVVYGGVKVGGIRISHLSHIDGDRTFMLTTKRGQRSEFTVRLLRDLPAYPADKFGAALEKAAVAIAEGRETAASIVAKLEAKGTLTSEQRQSILNLETTE